MFRQINSYFNEIPSKYPFYHFTILNSLSQKAIARNMATRFDWKVGKYRY